MFPALRSSNWRVQAPLAFCLALILILAFVVFRAFFLTFAVAGSVALLLAPAQRKLSVRLKGRRSLAAALLVVLCTLIILLPVLTYGTLITQQALAFVTWLGPQLEPANLERFWREGLPARYPLLATWIRQLTGGGTGVPNSGALLGNLAGEANHLLQVVLTNLLEAFFDGTLFLMMLFFLLRDGEELREVVRGVSPLTRGQETELIDHLTNTVRGVMQSMVIVPLAQGATALPAFWLLGLPSPLLWAVMVVFAALIPLIGSPLAWIPAGLYLLFKGSVTKGVIMLLYGALVISTVDNILKPLILKGAAQIHTMLGFLSILGGLYAFGPKGLIAGPVVLSLVLSAYRIYRYDILRWRDEAMEPAPPARAAG